MLIRLASLPQAALQKTVADSITERPIWGPRYPDPSITLEHTESLTLLIKLDKDRSSCDKLSLG